MPELTIQCNEDELALLEASGPEGERAKPPERFRVLVYSQELGERWFVGSRHDHELMFLKLGLDFIERLAVGSKLLVRFQPPSSEVSTSMLGVVSELSAPGVRLRLLPLRPLDLYLSDPPFELLAKTGAAQRPPRTRLPFVEAGGQVADILDEPLEAVVGDSDVSGRRPNLDTVTEEPRQ